MMVFGNLWIHYATKKTYKKIGTITLVRGRFGDKNMHEDLVCICLPVHNCENTIRVTLDSIIAQKYENFKLMIFDNFSTDTTHQICQEYEVRDPRVSVHRHHQNIGWGKNFNYAIEKMDGHYGCIIHGDDFYGPNFIFDNVKAISDRKNVLCFTKGIIFKSDHELRKFSKKLQFREVSQSKKQLVEKLLKYGNFLFCPTAFAYIGVWKKFICDFKYNDFGGGADLDAWLRVSDDLTILEIVNKGNFFHRRSDTQISSVDKRRTGTSVFVKVMKAHLELIKFHKLKIHKLSHSIESQCINKSRITMILRVLLCNGSFKMKSSCLKRILC